MMAISRIEECKTSRSNLHKVLLMGREVDLEVSHSSMRLMAIMP